MTNENMDSEQLDSVPKDQSVDKPNSEFSEAQLSQLEKIIGRAVQSQKDRRIAQLTKEQQALSEKISLALEQTDNDPTEAARMVAVDEAQPNKAPEKTVEQKPVDYAGLAQQYGVDPDSEDVLSAIKSGQSITEFQSTLLGVLSGKQKNKQVSPGSVSVSSGGVSPPSNDDLWAKILLLQRDPRKNHAEIQTLLKQANDNEV